jgi:hypothetical protein
MSSFVKQRTEIALNCYYYYYYYYVVVVVVVVVVCVNNFYFQTFVSITLSDITLKISTITTCIVANL